MKRLHYALYFVGVVGVALFVGSSSICVVDVQARICLE